jgi:hypothetical protein
MRRGLSLVVALSFPLSVYAQEAPAPAAPAPALSVQSAGERLSLPEKKGGTAFLFSGGAVAAGVVSVVGAVVLLSNAVENGATGGGFLGAAGASGGLAIAATALFTAGPSFGHIYSGAYKHAALFTGLRIGALGLSLLGSSQFTFNNNQSGGALSLIGSLSYFGLIVYDLIDAPLSVRRVKKEGFALKLAPTPLVSPDGAAAIGLGAAARF